MEESKTTQQPGHIFIETSESVQGTTLNPFHFLPDQNSYVQATDTSSAAGYSEIGLNMNDPVIEGPVFLKLSPAQLWPLRNQIFEMEENLLDEKVEHPIIESFSSIAKGIDKRIAGFYRVTETSLSRQRDELKLVKLILKIAYFPDPSSSYFQQIFKITEDGVLKSLRNTEPKDIFQPIIIGHERPLKVSDGKYYMVVNDVSIGSLGDSKMGRVGVIIRDWSALLTDGSEKCTLLNISCPFERVRGSKIEKVVEGQSVEYQLGDFILMNSDTGKYVISLEKTN